MGLSLSFRTAHSVPGIVRDEIAAEARDAAGRHPWILCDPVSLNPAEPGGQIAGFSMVHLFLPPDRLALAHDPDRNCHDLEALLIQLIEWSRRFRLTWLLLLAEEPIGTISNGQYAPELFDQFDTLADLALNPDVNDSEEWQELPARSIGVFEPRPSADRPRLRIWPEPE